MLKPRQQAKTIVNRPAQGTILPQHQILGEDELELREDLIAEFGWQQGDHLLVSREGGSLLITNLSQRDVAMTRFHREAKSIFRSLEDPELALRRVRIFHNGKLVQILEADDHECDEHCAH